MFFRLAAEKRFEAGISLRQETPELVTLYKVIQSDVKALIRARARHPEITTSELPKERSAHFYKVRRGLQPMACRASERAGRLLFLNRTVLQRSWRVNASAQFNVPFGKYAKPKILDIEVWSRLTRPAARRVHEGDISLAPRGAEARRLWLFRSAHIPFSEDGELHRYSADRFGPRQERLVRRSST